MSTTIPNEILDLMASETYQYFSERLNYIDDEVTVKIADSPSGEALDDVINSPGYQKKIFGYLREYDK